MALIECGNCKKKISDTRNICVHCGYKTKKVKKQNKLLMFEFLKLPVKAMKFTKKNETTFIKKKIKLNNKKSELSKNENNVKEQNNIFLKVCLVIIIIFLTFFTIKNLILLIDNLNTLNNKDDEDVIEEISFNYFIDYMDFNYESLRPLEYSYYENEFFLEFEIKSSGEYKVFFDIFTTQHINNYDLNILSLECSGCSSDNFDMFTLNSTTVYNDYWFEDKLELVFTPSDNFKESDENIKIKINAEIIAFL